MAIVQILGSVTVDKVEPAECGLQTAFAHFEDGERKIISGIPSDVKLNKGSKIGLRASVDDENDIVAMTIFGKQNQTLYKDPKGTYRKQTANEKERTHTMNQKIINYALSNLYGRK